MPGLILGFWLLFASIPATVHEAPAEDLWAATADPCAAARAIVEQGACTRPEDCGAFDGWMRLFGEPRTEPLDPQLTDRPVRPGAFLCLAQPERAARRGAGF